MASAPRRWLGTAWARWPRHTLRGVYTLKEAVLVSYHRSRLQQTMAGQGAMLAVGLDEAGCFEC